MILGGVVTRPSKSDFPRDYSTVKDLVKFVTTLNSRTWTHEEVFDRIQEIAVEILGVDKSIVTMEARWVEVLGVG